MLFALTMDGKRWDEHFVTLPQEKIARAFLRQAQVGTTSLGLTHPLTYPSLPFLLTNPPLFIIVLISCGMIDGDGTYIVNRNRVISHNLYFCIGIECGTGPFLCNLGCFRVVNGVNN